VCVLDTATGALLVSLATNSAAAAITSLAYSPDGTRLATGDWVRALLLFS
jgi:hypothetical protein